MTPHMEALAYRIWAYANPRGWKCSYAEIAEGIGLEYWQVNKVFTQKKWTGRVPHMNDDDAFDLRSRVYAGTYRRGGNIDPNLLAVDQLMR